MGIFPARDTVRLLAMRPAACLSMLLLAAAVSLAGAMPCHRAGDGCPSEQHRDSAPEPGAHGACHENGETPSTTHHVSQGPSAPQPTTPQQCPGTMACAGAPVTLTVADRGAALSLPTLPGAVDSGETHRRLEPHGSLLDHVPRR